MIGHTPALIPQLTLRENLIHVANLEMIGHDKVDRAIEVVGLDLAGDRLATESVLWDETQDRGGTSAAEKSSPIASR